MHLGILLVSEDWAFLTLSLAGPFIDVLESFLKEIIFFSILLMFVLPALRHADLRQDPHGQDHHP